MEFQKVLEIIKKSIFKELFPKIYNDYFVKIEKLNKTISKELSHKIEICELQIGNEQIFKCDENLKKFLSAESFGAFIRSGRLEGIDIHAELTECFKKIKNALELYLQDNQDVVNLNSEKKRKSNIGIGITGGAGFITLMLSVIKDVNSIAIDAATGAFVFSPLSLGLMIVAVILVVGTVPLEIYKYFNIKSTFKIKSENKTEFTKKYQQYLINESKISLRGLKIGGISKPCVVLLGIDSSTDRSSYSIAFKQKGEEKKILLNLFEDVYKGVHSWWDICQDNVEKIAKAIINNFKDLTVEDKDSATNYIINKLQKQINKHLQKAENQQNISSLTGKRAKKEKVFRMVYLLSAFVSVALSIFSLIFMLCCNVAFGSVNVTLLIVFMCITVALSVVQGVYIKIHTGDYVNGIFDGQSGGANAAEFFISFVSAGVGVGACIACCISYDTTDWASTTGIILWYLVFMILTNTITFTISIFNKDNAVHLACVILAATSLMCIIPKIVYDEPIISVKPNDTVATYTYSNAPNNKISITGYTDKSVQKLEIPTQIDGKTVTSISASAFKNFTSLKSVTIPDSISSIGDFAFWNCSGLTSITIPDSVTSIGFPIFHGCSSLESVTLPFVGYWCDGTVDGEKVDSICCPLGHLFGATKYSGSVATKMYYMYLYNGESRWATNTFFIPSTLKEVNVNGGEICDGAFYNCNSIESIVIGDNVTSIGEKSFYNCSGLKNVNIGNGVTRIGYEAFNGCNNLIKKIEGVTYIDNWLIDCDSTVKSVDIKTDIKGIADYAFQYCNKLTSITIPDSITSIGDQAFYNCSGLTRVTIGDGVISIGVSAFQNCSRLTSIIIPENVVKIGASAFYNCSSLSSVKFENVNNWYRYDSNNNSTYIPREDLVNDTTAAKYLKNTYFEYLWQRI